MTQTVAQRGGIIENLAERYKAAQEVRVAEKIHVKHYRPTAYDFDGVRVRSQNGGATIAYRHRNGDSFIEIATAVCSVRDMYNRKAGTTLSVESFMNGQVIRVPTYGATPGDVVDRLFGNYFEFDSFVD